MATVTSLGARIRKLRQAAGLTLEGLAERATVDLKHLQKVEAGTLNVTLATLVRIASGLGVEVRTLFPVRPKLLPKEQRLPDARRAPTHRRRPGP